MPIVDALDDGAVASTQQARSTNRSRHRAVERKEEEVENGYDTLLHN